MYLPPASKAAGLIQAFLLDEAFLHALGCGRTVRGIDCRCRPGGIEVM